MKIKVWITSFSLLLLLSACSKEEVQEPVELISNEPLPSEIEDSHNLEKIQLVEPIVYIEEGVSYKGHGEYLDVILEEYSATQKKYGIYYVGKGKMPNSTLEYKIIEERELGDKNPVFTGEVQFTDDYGQIVISCENVCEEMPKSTFLEFTDVPPYSERFYVEGLKLERHTE